MSQYSLAVIDPLEDRIVSFVGDIFLEHEISSEIRKEIKKFNRNACRSRKTWHLMALVPYSRATRNEVRKRKGGAV